MGKISRVRQRGSLFIMYSLMLMTVILPMIGMAIDLTIMYMIQAKLWEAVDGAALEGGHLLGPTAVPTIQTLVHEVCETNFPTGYWSAYIPTGHDGPCDSTNISITAPASPDYKWHVNVAGSVYAPVFFMKIFQSGDVLVSAAAQASRSNARVEMVMDRSGSMAGTMTTLKSVMAGFVTAFNGGYDQLGLVVFGTSAIVAYPAQGAGPYKFGTAADTTNGPDENFKNANGSNTTGVSCSPQCDMITAINKTASGGATSMAEGLSLAYIELQKAHNHYVATYGFDVMNNVIVFFTDGVPNMIPVYLNSPYDIGGTLPSGYPISGVTTSPGYDLLLTYNAGARANGQSKCTYNYKNPIYYGQPVASAQLLALYAHKMIGIIGSGGAPTSFTLNGGLLNMASFDTHNYSSGSGLSAWSMRIVQADEDYAKTVQAADGTVVADSVTNCDTIGNGNSSSDNLSVLYRDIDYIPLQDAFGNATTDRGTGHAASTASGFPTTTVFSSSSHRFGGTDSTNGRMLNVAAWNAVDNAAFRIRSDATLNIKIYTIGYSGNGGTDAGLLGRMANVYTYSDYTAAQPSGVFVLASNTSQLTAAFNQILSILLNLSR